MKLEEFWTRETQVLESLQAKIGGRPADEAASRPKVTGALERLQDRLKKVQGLRSEATARRQRAQADLAAAKARLANEGSLGNLPAATIAVRKQQARVQRHDGAIARASEEIFDLEAGVALLEEALGVVEGRLGAARTALAAATGRAQRRDAWIAAASAAPLDKLAGSTGSARAAKNAAPYTDARANLAARLGAELASLFDRRQAIATSLRGRSSAGLAEAIALLRGEDGAEGGGAEPGGAPDGSAPSLAAWTVAYDEAFAALGDYVKHGKERFDAALATLKGLATAPLATDDERTQLQSGAFTEGPARDRALALAKARDEALRAHLEALASAERALVEELAADPDAAVTTGPPDREAVDAADAAYGAETTAGDETSSPHALVAQWQTALPDPTYKAAAAFYAATDALDDLVATPGSGDETTLAQQLAAAEDGLATARSRAAAAERRAAFLQLVLGLQRKRAAHVELVRGDLLFGLLRGDV
jgi:hypothetical protein